jgi:hypothetical protein
MKQKAEYGMAGGTDNDSTHTLKCNAGLVFGDGCGAGAGPLANASRMSGAMLAKWEGAFLSPFPADPVLHKNHVHAR